MSLCSASARRGRYDGVALGHRLDNGAVRDTGSGELRFAMGSVPRRGGACMQPVRVVEGGEGRTREEATECGEPAAHGIPLAACRGSMFVRRSFGTLKTAAAIIKATTAAASAATAAAAAAEAATWRPPPAGVAALQRGVRKLRLVTRFSRNHRRPGLGRKRSSAAVLAAAAKSASRVESAKKEAKQTPGEETLKITKTETKTKGNPARTRRKSTVQVAAAKAAKRRKHGL